MELKTVFLLNEIEYDALHTIANINCDDVLRCEDCPLNTGLSDCVKRNARTALEKNRRFPEV